MTAKASELKALCDDADLATWHIGYLRAVLDNPEVPTKLNNSYAGYALEVAGVAVKRSLVLYCARAWDKGDDCISLPALTSRLPEPSDVMRPRYDAYMTRFRAAEDDHCHGGIRSFRSEWQAHRVIHSKDRKKAEALGMVTDATMTQLVERAQTTVNLVGDLAALMGEAKVDYSGRIAHAERCCREFWRVLPKLSEVERRAATA